MTPAGRETIPETDKDKLTLSKVISLLSLLQSDVCQTRKAITSTQTQQKQFIISFMNNDAKLHPL